MISFFACLSIFRVGTLGIHSRCTASLRASRSAFLCWWMVCRVSFGLWMARCERYSVHFAGPSLLTSVDPKKGNISSRAKVWRCQSTFVIFGQALLFAESVRAQIEQLFERCFLKLCSVIRRGCGPCNPSTSLQRFDWRWRNCLCPSICDGIYPCDGNPRTRCRFLVERCEGHYEFCVYVYLE